MRPRPCVLLPVLICGLLPAAEQGGHEAVPAVTPRAEVKTVAAPAEIKPVAKHADRKSATPLAEAHPAMPGSEKAAQGLSGQQALDRLLTGNKRFIADLTSRSHQGAARRIAIAKSQHPVAVVVCCSDSRSGPETIFDQGLGDLFVVRTAGHVLDGVALGSIEYACEHLHVPLVVVLGHERCGAVTAAVEGGTPTGHVQTVVELVQRNIGPKRGEAGDAVEQAVQSNARAVARQISTSTPLLAGLISSEELTVVALRYDLDDGEVAVLP